MINYFFSNFGKNGEPKSKPKTDYETPLSHFGALHTSGKLLNRDYNDSINTRDKKYQTYGKIIDNVPIVSAGVTATLDLVSSANWVFTPSEADVDRKYVKLAEQIFYKNLDNSFKNIVKRAAMYKFYGFFVGEIVTKTDKKGNVLLKNISFIPQSTVSGWHFLDNSGEVGGLHQQVPNLAHEIYIERKKLWYIVDQSLHNTPEGTGLLKLIVEPALKLKDFEDLQYIGFNNDLNGVPYFKAPLEEMRKYAQQNGLDPEVFVKERLQAVMEYAIKHPKCESSSYIDDSAVYTSLDESGKPSNVPMWDLKILQSNATSFTEIRMAMESLKYDIARSLNVEQFLLGENTGSFALSSDKSQLFFMLVDTIVDEIKNTMERDVFKLLWSLNNLPEEMYPVIKIDTIKFRDPESRARVMGSLAAAGVRPDPYSKAVSEIFESAGLTPPDKFLEQQEETNTVSLPSTSNNINNEN